MGQQVEGYCEEQGWVRGTILGVHDGNIYDILYEGGEGDMMKAGEAQQVVEQ